jgi:hypothetical protein
LRLGVLACEKNRKIHYKDEPVAKLLDTYEKAKETDKLEFEQTDKSGGLRYENDNRNTRRSTSPS